MLNLIVEDIPWQIELETFQEEFENIKPLEYEKIKQELDTYVVQLDADPSSVGVGRLNEKIANVNSNMSRVATIVMNAIKNEDIFKKVLKKVKRLYATYLRIQLRQKDIADLSNQTLRQSAAEEILCDIERLQFSIELVLDDAKTHTEICKVKLDNLDITNKNISRQLTVIQDQLVIGEIQRKINRNDPNF